MFLAVREMRRAVVRFGLLALAIGLLVFLILFQQALRDGLITSFVGALRSQPESVLVYSVDAQRTLQASVIPPPLESAVRGTEGVAEVGRLGQGTFTAQIGGGEQIDATIIGTDTADLGRPQLLVSGRSPGLPGEAIGSDADFKLGDTVTIVSPPGQEPVRLTVVGLASDAQLNVTPTLFSDFATFGSAVRAVNPGAGEPLPNALTVRAQEGVEPAALAAAIEDSAPDAEALTPAEAADRTPGVDQVRQSFQVIFFLYGLVVPLVTGLFFLIITVQKSRSLTLLRAMGARSGTLSRALLTQVVAVMGAGLALGIALYTPLSLGRVGGLALRFDTAAVLAWSALLMILGLVGSAVSFRRVLTIDPLEATTGGGLQ